MCYLPDALNTSEDAWVPTEHASQLNHDRRQQQGILNNANTGDTKTNLPLRVLELGEGHSLKRQARRRQQAAGAARVGGGVIPGESEVREQNGEKQYSSDDRGCLGATEER